MKKTTITFILILFNLLTNGQDIITPYLSLHNDRTYFLTSQIPTAVSVSFFSEIIGQPSRIKKHKTVNNNIYDDIGIIIVYDPQTQIVSRILFIFKPSSKDDPRNAFHGKIQINNVALDYMDSRKSIREKLPEFQVQGTLSYFIYKHANIQFQCMAPMDEQEPAYSLSYDFK